MDIPPFFRLNWDALPPHEYRGGAVAVGNFDGVHRGHGSLLGLLRLQAAEVGGPAVVLTFDPHPLELLAPERFQPVLTTWDQRAYWLVAGGADGVAVIQTTPDLLRLSPEDFFERILRQGFDAKAIVELCGGRSTIDHAEARPGEILKSRARVDRLPRRWGSTPVRVAPNIRPIYTLPCAVARAPATPQRSVVGGAPSAAAPRYAAAVARAASLPARRR